MPAPTISTVSPSSGLTRGRTYVLITGTNFPVQEVGEGDEDKVLVKFGTDEALNVQVQSATRIVCQSPSHDPGVVSVSVQNIDTEQTATKASAFTYGRPNLTAPSHLQEVIEAVVRIFRREVIEDVSRLSHSEYDPNTSDTKSIPQHASLPCITLNGPLSGPKDAWTETQESTSITYDAGGDPVSFEKRRAPTRCNLVFELTIGARFDVELFSLVHHTTETLTVTPKLAVLTQSGTTLEYDWDLIEEFDLPSKANDSDVREASCRFVVQGVLFEDGETLEQGPVTDSSSIILSYGSQS